MAFSKVGSWGVSGRQSRPVTPQDPLFPRPGAGIPWLSQEPALFAVDFEKALLIYLVLILENVVVTLVQLIIGKVRIALSDLDTRMPRQLLGEF